MHRLTAKEEEIMSFFWDNGALFVKQIHEFYTDGQGQATPLQPRPHYNTLSTIVRGLEEKKFVGYTAYGNTHQYHALITKEEYRRNNLKNVVSRYFDNSYRRVVSALIEEEALSIEELKELIREVEANEKECHCHCGLDPHSPEKKEMLKKVQHDTQKQISLTLTMQKTKK